MQSGRFSIVAFYERRIRRIFPALLVMMFAVTLLAYFFLLPVEMTEFARSLLAALGLRLELPFLARGRLLRAAQRT